MCGSCREVLWAGDSCSGSSPQHGILIIPKCVALMEEYPKLEMAQALPLLCLTIASWQAFSLVPILRSIAKKSCYRGRIFLASTLQIGTLQRSSIPEEYHYREIAHEGPFLTSTSHHKRLHVWFRCWEVYCQLETEQAIPIPWLNLATTSYLNQLLVGFWPLLRIIVSHRWQRQNLLFDWTLNCR